MVNQRKPSEQRLILTSVNWQKYEQLLQELSEGRQARLTYDRGKLEMMNPLEEHERCHKLIESLILLVADELHLQVVGYPAPTLKRSDLSIGTEPEAAYYIQTAALMQSQTEIDLAVDPPPDLILEVELSRSEINKFALYAQLGVREVWRYISKPGDHFLKGNFFIHSLQGDRYLEDDYGLAFPFLSAGRILQFIDQSDAIGLMPALRDLRHWIQEQR